MTDREGRFRIELDDPRTFSNVEVASEDGRFTGSARDVRVARGGSPLVVQVGPPAVLRGTVTTRSGARVPGRRVLLSKLGLFEPQQELVTDERGDFETTLAAGTYDLIVPPDRPGGDGALLAVQVPGPELSVVLGPLREHAP